MNPTSCLTLVSLGSVQEQGWSTQGCPCPAASLEPGGASRVRVDSWATGALRWTQATNSPGRRAGRGLLRADAQGAFLGRPADLHLAWLRARPRSHADRTPHHRLLRHGAVIPPTQRCHTCV